DEIPAVYILRHKLPFGGRGRFNTSVPEIAGARWARPGGVAGPSVFRTLWNRRQEAAMVTRGQTFRGIEYTSQRQIPESEDTAPMPKALGLKAKVENHPSYGVPRRIYDIESRASKAKPEKIARDLLRRIAPSLGIRRDLSQLKLDQVK